MRGGTNCTGVIDASAECGDGSALVWEGNPEVGAEKAFQDCLVVIPTTK